MRRRYLKLDGTAPDISGRIRRHLYSAESKTAAIFVVATAASAWSAGGLGLAFAAAACGIGAAAAAQTFAKRFTRGSLSHHFGTLDACHFDCMPDSQTPPTRPAHMIAAGRLASYGTATAVALGALSIPHTAGLIGAGILFPAIAAPAVLSAALTGLLGLNMATCAAFIAWRFHRVARGDWVIIDRPPGTPHKPPSNMVMNILPVPREPVPA